MTESGQSERAKPRPTTTEDRRKKSCLAVVRSRRRAIEKQAESRYRVRSPRTLLPQSACARVALQLPRDRDGAKDPKTAQEPPKRLKDLPKHSPTSCSGTRCRCRPARPAPPRGRYSCSRGRACAPFPPRERRGTRPSRAPPASGKGRSVLEGVLVGVCGERDSKGEKRC